MPVPRRMPPSPGDDPVRTVTLSRYCETESDSSEVCLSKLTINCLEEGQSFVLEAEYELIEHIFHGLEDLYWKSPMKLSSSHIVGLLLTNDNDLHHYCGHILSTSALESAVTQALTASVIEVFASLCCFLIPSIRCMKCDSRGRKIPMVAGPHIPVADRLYGQASHRSELDTVSAGFEQAMTTFCRSSGDVDKPSSFAAVVKQWMKMKKFCNIQSDNNELAQKIDAKLLAAYEAILRTGAEVVPDGAHITNMVRRCVEEQLKGRSTDTSSAGHRPVLTNMPIHFQKLLQADLWPLLVLSETFGVERLFSALSYVMLQQLRMDACTNLADFEMSERERQLLSDLTEEEGNLDDSLSLENQPETPVADTRDSYLDISVEQSRRNSPPLPHVHPEVVLRESASSLAEAGGALHSTAMFDDDEDSNRTSSTVSSPQPHGLVSRPPTESVLAPTKSDQTRQRIRPDGVLNDLPKNESPAAISARHNRADATTPTDKKKNNHYKLDKAKSTDVPGIGTPEYEARQRALNRLREKARQEASRQNEDTGSDVKQKLAIVQTKATIARARSASPVNRVRRKHGASTEAISPRPLVNNKHNNSDPAKTPTKGRIDKAHIWGSPSPVGSNYSVGSSPKTPTTVVDIDEAVSRATLKAKERIYTHRRELEAKLLQEQKEAEEMEEEKWRERDRRLSLFLNRQKVAGKSHLVSEIDRDPRGHSVNTLHYSETSDRKSVRFHDPEYDPKTIIYKNYESNNGPVRRIQNESDVTEGEANSVPRVAEKVKKYRRFTKLLYGETCPTDARLESSNGQDYNSTDRKSQDLYSSHASGQKVDAVDFAEEVETLINSTLTPIRSGDTDPNITGYINDIHKNDYSAEYYELGTMRRSNVFSPDATYRHEPEEYSYHPERSGRGISLCPTVKVLRAANLPEMLSGCNPYVIIAWGSLGETVTSTKVNSTNPSFKEMLSFEKGEDMTSDYPSMDIYVFHKNVSVSDEFIGKGHISEVNISEGVHAVHLFDVDGDDAGEVVLEICMPALRHPS